MSFLIVMVLLLVVMYVLMIRPQRQRQRDHQSLIEGAGVGDDILTTGGIYGTITRVEGDDVVVEIADGLNVHMTRRGIAAVLPPEDETSPETIDAEAVEEPEDDEPAVTAREEAVTSEADAEATAGDRR
ncbi:MAG TPA: preprotein translocase subunit YajC [Gaiellaceae bacterium]|nr:preprotein translocase subunit YajC [Gaiellaceae bacterium]